MRPTKLYPELVDYIRRQRRAGCTLADIVQSCQKAGEQLSIATVRSAALGVPSQKRRPGRAGHTREFRAAVLVALRAGEKHRWIATRFGISTGLVWKWQREAAIPLRCPQRAKRTGALKEAA